MSKVWRWHQAALDEARQAAAWYDRRRTGLGDAFVSELEGKLAWLEEAPSLGTLLPRSLDA